MPTVGFYTYRDAVRHCCDYLGSNASEDALRDSRRAVLAGYRELATAARWSYYYQLGRVNTVAQYNTGTIAYTNSSRQVTLTGGTFPSWAPFGVMAINNVTYQVASMQSATVLTLSTNSNPGQDLASGTLYALYRDTYPLPADFVAADSFIQSDNYWVPTYAHPRYWLDHQRFSKTPAVPRMYTFTSDPHYFGTMAVRFFPPPDNAYPYDFIYQRRPRQANIYEQKTGTVTVAASSATVAGTGTNFDPSWVGSVLRISADAVNLPEGAEWDTPFVEEHVITSVASSTSLTVDSAFANTYSGVLYIVSDPLDVEHGAMLNALLRCVEKQVCTSRKQKDLKNATELYQQALILAREADARHFEESVAGKWGPYRQRLAYMPRGPDIS